MQLENKIMLITYADSLGGSLQALRRTLGRHYREAVGGVHILPFFPSSADRGFAPIRYDAVDPAFGSFADIDALGQEYYLMFDFMLNHLSAHSPQYLDFLAKKDASACRDFFIRYRDFWPDGEPTPAQVDRIYKRKPRAPYVEAHFADGSTEKVWCTFCEEQIDLNVQSPAVKDFVRRTLTDMAAHGASVIRLDAFAYAYKKPDTSCFFVEPEIWQLLHETEAILAPQGITVLPEIHEHYSIQMKIAQQGFWIYDFALPVLTLHAIYNHTGKYLKHWLEMSPKKQFTTLDTHDGIGIVDVKDLLPDEALDTVREQMFSNGANVKKIYNTAAYNNLDIYQVNTTYYSALGNRDDRYLLARAIQFFAPGIPMVYYVGMLAGENDLALMEKTRNGRDINRHCYTEAEIDAAQQRPVVAELKKLMRLRNSCPAFALDGDIRVEAEGSRLVITRTAGSDFAVLDADLGSCRYAIRTGRTTE